MNEIIHITSLDLPELSYYRDLREKELKHYREPEEGYFIAESPKIIMRALNAGYQPVSALMEEPLNQEHKVLLESMKDVKVYLASHQLLTALTGYQLVHGALCLMQRQKQPHPMDILANARRVAVIDDVENPVNVGLIFRNAAAFRIDGVLLTRGCADPLYRRAVRTSMGNVFYLPWCFNDDVYGTLRKQEFKIAGLCLDKRAVAIDNEKLNSEKRLAIVLGNEEHGLSDGAKNKCDYLTIIPIQDKVDSLNVAAASAVAFYQLQNKTTY